ncbi:MAG: FMN-binding glutamate synthase family protein [Planctomycetota bacterium]|nr:FMN-binding glutamate synthase family protein [Planctomycetota bacterium]
MGIWFWIILSLVGLIVAVALWDLVQRKHAIRRNFPIIGHFRYLFEAVGPELRQYIVTSNNEELPFNRDQRRWVYASAKRQNNYFGFGSDNDMENSNNYIIIKHRTLPVAMGWKAVPDDDYALPCAKVLGAARGRTGAFRPRSVINISAMSFGSLSAPAVEALNRGSKIAGCLHNTGEGGISPYHKHGADLIWQIGTGYFGCRDGNGRFDFERFKDEVAANPVRAIEIKLSQGAKPGMGGILPAAKISPEIARLRGIPLGKDCISPPGHSTFHDPDSLLDFVEMLASETGLPVGIKSAVGEDQFWKDLARLMATTKRGVDFVTVDGGEGGTGAGPLAFTDHVSLPFKLAQSRVYRAFALENVHRDVVFIGSGKLGFPESALLAFAMGCDLINVAREAMMAVGCIQAQRCHTDHCPTGVATQNRWLMRGLDPTHKAARLANYVVTLRRELIYLSRACGVSHPSLIGVDDIEILDDRFRAKTPRELFDYHADWGTPSPADQEAICGIMAGDPELPPAAASSDRHEVQPEGSVDEPADAEEEDHR